MKKIVIEIDDVVYKEITSHTDKYYSFVYLSLDQLRRLDNAIRIGKVIREKEFHKHKCKECKWLSDHKKKIGYECINPIKPFRRSSTAKYKYTSTPACSLFEAKGDNDGADKTN